MDLVGLLGEIAIRSAFLTLASLLVIGALSYIKTLYNTFQDPDKAFDAQLSDCTPLLVMFASLLTLAVLSWKALRAWELSRRRATRPWSVLRLVRISRSAELGSPSPSPAPSASLTSANREFAAIRAEYDRQLRPPTWTVRFRNAVSNLGLGSLLRR